MLNIFEEFGKLFQNIINNIIHEKIFVKKNTDFGYYTNIITNEYPDTTDFNFIDDNNPLEELSSYNIKKIVVYPETEYSSDSNITNSCHFIITNGKATVIIDDDELNFTKKQHFFTPKGCELIIKNNYNFNLKIICIEFSEN